jgi:hypothetical protein
MQLNKNQQDGRKIPKLTKTLFFWAIDRQIFSARNEDGATAYASIAGIISSLDAAPMTRVTLGLSKLMPCVGRVALFRITSTLGALDVWIHSYSASVSGRYCGPNLG